MRIEFPQVADGDTDDVRWALETAVAMWTQGDARGALRWLKTAAETASEQGADMRSLSLAKAAAELRNALDAAPEAAAPEAPPASAAPPTPEPANTATAGPSSAVPPTPRPASAGPPPRPAHAEAPPGPPPAPPPSGKGSVSLRSPTPRRALPKPPPPKSQRAPAAPESPSPAPPPPRPAINPEPAESTQEVVVQKSPPLPFVAQPPAEPVAPDSAPTSTPSALPHDDRETLVQPIQSGHLDMFEGVPTGTPPPPIDTGSARAIQHQAVRVSIHPLEDQPGVFLTQILAEGAPAPRGGAEALLVALTPQTRLLR